jgi:four helix bundle protein
MQRFTELAVWQKSHQLALAVYRESAALPGGGTFGMTSQLRRTIVSVSSNIAEGAQRESRKECPYLLNVAQGSLVEVASMLAGLGRAVDGKRRRRTLAAVPESPTANRELSTDCELPTANCEPVLNSKRGGHQ